MAALHLPCSEKKERTQCRNGAGETEQKQTPTGPVAFNTTQQRQRQQGRLHVGHNSPTREVSRAQSEFLAPLPLSPLRLPQDPSLGSSATQTMQGNRKIPPLVAHASCNNGAKAMGITPHW